MRYNGAWRWNVTESLFQELRDILGRPPKVVVALQDRFALGLIRTTLENGGCEVRITADGEEAWRWITEDPPDLVVTEAHLPRLDGLTLCRRVKEHPRSQFVPVILTTPIDTDEERLRAIDAGADEVLIKPFRPSILFTRTRSLLRLKHLHDLLEERRRLLRQVLNLYLDPDLAQLILEDPQRHLRLGGESRRLTLIFADLRGFTAFTERFPATQVVDTLNQIFNALTEEVMRHQGVLDKYIGDAIMALFGVPWESPDAPLRALQTAWAMQQRFAQLRAEAPPNAPLRALRGLGIGVHTGEAIVGNIGSQHFMDYTAVGATVNLCSRLQEMARPGEILLSQETLDAVPGAQVSFVAEMLLPGAMHKMTIYRLERLPEG